MLASKFTVPVAAVADMVVRSSGDVSIGAVKVLLVRVSVPVNVATPVRVLLATLIVLLVKVSVVALPTKVSLVVAGNVSVLVPATAVA